MKLALLTVASSMLSENVSPIRDFVETAVALLAGMTVSITGGLLSGSV